MRFVSMIFGLTFLFISVMPVTQAYADRERHMENPCGKREYMERHAEKQKMKRRAKQLMEEGMDMWLEAVQLIKESSTDPRVKKKAAALEKRMRANIHEHKALHKMMHDMHSEHKKRYEHGEKRRGDDHNPCGMRGM